MTFSKEQIEALKAPLNKSHVKQRSQAGRALSYIEGWHAIDEANRIFGFDAWVRETAEIRQVCEAYQDQKGNWRVGYMAKVRIVVLTPESKDHDTWHGDSKQIIREGCGFGSGIDRDLGQAHESALKEAETDAMKRALMTFGNPFGLALYDKEQKNVVEEPSVPYATIEDAITDCLTLENLASVMETHRANIDKLNDPDKANLRRVYAFKKEALKKFGEAAE